MIKYFLILMVILASHLSFAAESEENLQLELQVKEVIENRHKLPKWLQQLMPNKEMLFSLIAAGQVALVDAQYNTTSYDSSFEKPEFIYPWLAMCSLTVAAIVGGVVIYCCFEKQKQSDSNL